MHEVAEEGGRTGKVPHIEKAIRVVPHGKQAGMKTRNLRGMVEINPYKDDLFRRVIEQRKLHKSNKDLYYWLKIFANSMYGFFVEINPEVTSKENPVRVQVYSDDEHFEHKEPCHVAETTGKWYAPYLASLITSGGRLLLAMLEECVTRASGSWLYADTDALAIVSSEHGGSLKHIPGCEQVRALSWNEVNEIAARFEKLNPYDRKAVPGSILNLTDDNFSNSDPKNPRRQLLGMSISAKRYALYERAGNKITIVNPKAHGLGYLYPPVDSPEGWDEDHDAPKWIYDAWEWLVRKLLNLRADDPPWFDSPQMMRMSVTTHNVLERMHNWPGFRPYNFFLYPILNEYGHLKTEDGKGLSLVAPFESNQSKWPGSVCIDISDPLNGDRREYKLITDFLSAEFGLRHTAVVEAFRTLLYRYMRHPEYKSLGPDGNPCKSDTRGLLQRVHVHAGKHRRIGKECDRHWEEGDDFESTVLWEPIEYTRKGDVPAQIDGMAKARERLIRCVRKVGFPELIEHGCCSRHHLRNICRRELVRVSVLREYERKVQEYRQKRR